MDISKWGFQNRNLVYFLVAVLLAGGALACYQMSKLEDPEIKVKLAMVATTYPGASAHQVELEVTDVLEKSIRKMDNVDNVESYSFNDLSLIQVELLTTVKDDDVEQHWDLLRRKVNDASALLPSGANTPIVQDDFGKVFGMFYALTGDGLSDREMADYAELIKREVIEIEHAQMRLVDVEHLVSDRLGVVQRHDDRAERDAVEPVGEEEDASLHVLQREIGPQHLLVEGIFLLADLLGVIPPVPRFEGGTGDVLLLSLIHI